MGALHEGHLSLVRASLSACQVTVATIFVNPTQFDNKDDLAKYPRTLESDVDLLRNEGCDYLFVPDVEEVYPGALDISIKVGSIASTMEGQFREGHFDGVALVVTKLLNIVRADLAFFGQKDLQQFRIIAGLIKELFLDQELVMMPIVREPSGLAMSSRNKRLSEQGMAQASVLNEALELGMRLINAQESLATVRKQVEDLIANQEGVELEYFEIVSFESLEPIEAISAGEQLALCLACYVEQVRLIDNIVFTTEREG